MKSARKHRFVAFLFDLCVLGSVVGIVSSLVISLTSPSLADSVDLLVGVVFLLVFAVYHLALAGRSGFCTPGESMAGCRVTRQGKEWSTIYTRSRWFLFLTLFLLLLSPGNAFDVLRMAGTFPLLQVLSISCYVVVFVWAVYRVALGGFLWSIALYAFLGLHVRQCFALLGVEPQLARMGFWMAALQGASLSIALIVYRDRTSAAVHPCVGREPEGPGDE